MLSLVKLHDAEYVLSQIANGLEEYYVSGREAPGVWAGRWSERLELSGVVEAEALRRLVKGVDPRTGTAFLEGPARKVNAFDATFSAPKSASLAWALGGPEVESAVSLAHVEAVSTAVSFLESHMAVARQQKEGVRTRVPTDGLAVATFVHRTSRAGDPQLHTHCVVPNLVRRPDGSHVALDAGPLYEWARAAGCVYQEELRRRLTAQLGVEWGPDRNGCREMVGFEESQLRTFSKRTTQIEAWLEAHGSSAPQSPAERMAADEAASLATRTAKDEAVAPEALAGRWAEEAAAVGLGSPKEVAQRVCGRSGVRPAPSAEVIFAHLVDPEAGLCSRRARFGQAQVAAAIASHGGGTLDAQRVEELSAEFLASAHVVRLAPDPAVARRRPPQWSLVTHRALEDRVLSHLHALQNRADPGLGLPWAARQRLIGDGLGRDQAQAVTALGAPGPALRALLSPAGHGKTTTLAAAGQLVMASGRDIIGLAATNQAVAELEGAGVPAVTIARLQREARTLRPGTVVILDEVSQVATADAEIVTSAVTATPGAALWCAGDAAQAQSVRAGGLAVEVERLGRAGTVPAPRLTHNRRQVDETERAALTEFRAGHVETSQRLRAEGGLEHELDSPSATKAAMADAVVGDVHIRGAQTVAALCVTHGDAEELADRIRAQLGEVGRINGPVMWGPGWTTARAYARGDRVLLHAPFGTGDARLHNNTTATVMSVGRHGLTIRTDDGRATTLDPGFVAGGRPDGRPNLSHGWARTVEGAQGGTWDQVHLLGNAALGQEKGYVGQSRGRRPTHTWNVRRVPETDYGGHRVQAPTAAHEVRAALEREDRQVFAATEDP
ncbi:MAG TPA: MobF family relaxase, partial [Acidimicrobiales bacterium]|nr:MobF family relaxase [Acidimicrobiales bacterium]